MQTSASTFKLIRIKKWWNQNEHGCCLFHDEYNVRTCLLYPCTVIVYIIPQKSQCQSHIRTSPLLSGYKLFHLPGHEDCCHCFCLCLTVYCSQILQFLLQILCFLKLLEDHQTSNSIFCFMLWLYYGNNIIICSCHVKTVTLKQIMHCV